MFWGPCLIRKYATVSPCPHPPSASLVTARALASNTASPEVAATCPDGFAPPSPGFLLNLRELVASSGEGLSPTEAAAKQRASLFCQRMRSRHLDLLKTLSTKNHEKEELQKKEERRLVKRETLLRERILQRSQSTDAPQDVHTVPPATSSTAVPRTDEAALTDEELRLHKLRCNSGIEKRQQEALAKLAAIQHAEKILKEREKLKKEWSAHRAKRYLVSSCQNEDVKKYLESKGKPPALPKIPAATPPPVDPVFDLSIRGLSAEAMEEATDISLPDDGMDAAATTEVEDDNDQNRSSSPTRKYERNCSSPAKSFLPSGATPQTMSSVSRFLERTRNTRAASHYYDIAEWKRRNGCEADRQVFICNGGYPDFRDAMLKRGFFQNMDKDSKHFDFKWGMARDMDHDRLKPHQIVNHFDKCRDLTTKVGLNINLRSCIWHAGASDEEFYPRAFDLSEPAERADFVSDFKFSKAQSILRQFIQHMAQEAETTFSEDVVDTATKICLRQLTDVDDVLDCPEIAEHLANVKADEWALLKTVCLEDPTRRLEDVVKDQDVEDLISRTAIADVQKKRATQDEKEKKNAEREAEMRRSMKGKKKKKQGETPEETPVGAETSSFQSLRGQHLLSQAKSIIQQLENKSAQHQIHGARNAWIIKPAGKSRGRGIQVMRELDEIFKATESEGFQWVCQKYIEQPQLIHGYKFDIRQWVLVTDWNPLTVYIWQQPYLRFAGQKYDDSLSDLSEYMHLVNNSIIKNQADFNEKNADLNASGYMWFRQQYEEWLHDTHCRCKHHSTPWKIAPPYTCETFGVKWEDVAFTAKEEEDDEDDEGVGLAESVTRPLSEEVRGSILCEQCGTTPTAKAEGVRPSSTSNSEESVPTQQDMPLEPEVPQSLQECPCGRHFGPQSKFCQGCGTSRQDAEAAVVAAAKKAEEQAATCKEETVEPDDAGESAECENLWDTGIKPQIQDIVTWSLLSVVDSIGQRKNSFELYGYDFMLSSGPDGKPKVWLIEVNSSPACDYSTPVTTPLVKKMMEDIAKVMVDKRANPECETGEWELLNHQYTTKVGKVLAGAMLEKDKLEVTGTQVKPCKAKKAGGKKKKGKSAKAKTSSSGHDTAAREEEKDGEADLDEDDGGNA